MTCTSSIIHSFALTESEGLITVQPEGGRGERDVNVQLDQRAGRMAQRAHAGVYVCEHVCGREPGVLMCDSQYAAVGPVERIHLNR